MMHFTQAVAPQAQAGSGLLGQAGALEAGKGFDRDQIAKLKDACGVQQAKDIPHIWYVIQSTKEKAYDTYRDHIKKSIEMWCRKCNIERDKSIFLKQSFFDDLVKLCFNPGGPVAQYDSVDRGISMLVCQSLSAAEVELQRGYEEATELTKSTRRLKDLLKEKNKITMPAQNFMKLKLNMSTFCALLWALFGDQYDYYRELLKLHNILDREECFTIRDAYTKEVCARIMWAIIDDGRCYFGCNPVALDFAPGTNFKFSVSFLNAITNEVRHGLAVQRANFPLQWKTPTMQIETAPTSNRQQQPCQHAVPSVPPPATWPTSPPTKVQGQPMAQKQALQEDTRHPKIRALMDPYLAKYNNYIDLGGILNTSGKKMRDLPSLPQYCTPTGSPLICWNNVLGRCFRGKRCKFLRGHVRKGDVTEAFAEAVVDCIGKNVLFFMETPLAGGSPKGKRKATAAINEA